MKPSTIQIQVSEYWNWRAPAFDGVASHVAQASLWRDVLSAAFEAKGAKDVVDFGTGTGACALIAASLGHRVRACDGSDRMLAVARQAAEASGLEVAFEHALIEEASFAPGSADIVTLRNVLWTLPDPMAALHTARLVLRPGGLVLVSDGLWSVSPQDRSTYPEALAASLPRHAGLTDDEGRAMLDAAGFGTVQSWQHLFPASPYPGDVPMFVLTARKS